AVDYAIASVEQAKLDARRTALIDAISPPFSLVQLPCDPRLHLEQPISLAQLKRLRNQPRHPHPAQVFRRSFPLVLNLVFAFAGQPPTSKSQYRRKFLFAARSSFQRSYPSPT